MMNNILSKLKGFFNASDKWLLDGFDVAAQRKKAYDFACSVCERWDVPRGGDVPADLRDERGHWYKTRDGKLITGVVFKSDLMQGDESVRAIMLSFPPLIIAGLAAVLSVVNVILYLIAYKFGWMSGGTFGALMSAEMVIVMLFSALMFFVYSIGFKSSGADFVILGLAVFFGSFLHTQAEMMVTPFSMTAFLLFGFAIAHMRNDQLFRLTDMRSFGLELQAAADPGENSRVEMSFKAASDARLQQAINAARDTSTFIDLGTATGIFSELGDKFAPDEGLIFGMTIKDMSTGLMIFGETGGGKTSAVLRPIARQISKGQECGRLVGMMVLDGKAKLATDLADSIDNYKVISPVDKTIEVGLIEGLDTEDVVATILGLRKKAAADPFWDNTGETMLRSVCSILEALRDRKSSEYWTMTNISRACTDGDYRDNLIRIVEQDIATEDEEDLDDKLSLLPFALRYFKGEFESFDEKLKGNIATTVNAWVSPVLGHRDLLRWAGSHTGVRVESVLEGARIGISVPGFKYGTAGDLISAFLKARVFRALKVRGDGWENMPGQTSVVMLMDEAQKLITSQDVDMFDVGRGNGLRAICATQQLVSIENGLGDEKMAQTMLGNLLSVIAIMADSETIEHVSNKIGRIYRRQSVEGEANGMNVKRMAESCFSTENNSTVKLDWYDSVGSPKGSSAGYGAIVMSKLNRKAELPDVHKAKEGGNGEPKVTSPFAFETELAPLMSEGEIEAWLRLPFTAICQVKRGNILRRDVVKLKPIFN